MHNKHKKGGATEPKPDPADPKSQESLQLLPIGQDSSRKRYWVTDGPCIFVISPFSPKLVFACICCFRSSPFAFTVPWTGRCRFSHRLLEYSIDTNTFLRFIDSPRVYVSTNPWKVTATFQTVCSTREEYAALIEGLKNSAPPPLKKNQKRNKLDQGHFTLIENLEGRIEGIDAELAVSIVRHIGIHFMLTNTTFFTARCKGPKEDGAKTDVVCPG